jgi:hypothetical protein
MVDINLRILRKMSHYKSVELEVKKNITNSGDV